MPDWSRPADLVFDHHAAGNVIDQIDRTIASLSTSMAALDRFSLPATPRWSGRLAEAYAADELRWRQALGNLVTDLRALAERTARAIEDALAESARVARIQGEWDAQQVAEQLHSSVDQ